MTKLVRKLKQMAKKRAHRKTVQKRKVERAQRELEQRSEQKSQRLEDEVDREMARLNGELENEASARAGASCRDTEDAATSAGVKRAVRIVGDLVVDAPMKKNAKQLTRKQVKRKKRLMERGLAVSDSLSKKWDHKKRCIKVRAQIRNEDLQN